MSIVMGVIHMLVGIFLSLLNAIHFGHGIDIIGEFIPQMIFMLCLFGYMCFLIIFKWCTYWTTTPPFILNVMIDMFLQPYTVTPENQMFEGQFYVQVICLISAVIAVPWMLATKPLYLKNKHKRKMLAKPVNASEDEDHDDGEPFDYGEILVKQIIHTIEFVLGAISNTASYLRLWALSLAHSELSQVFLSKSSCSNIFSW